MTSIFTSWTCLAAMVAALLITESASADIIFSDFSDTSILTINGSSATTTTGDGVVMRLTPAVSDRGGSVFSTARVSTAEFTSVFSFRITDNGGPIFDGNHKSGADGLVFVVQNQANNVGSIGQGIGYQGIAPSLGVEFDTWHNSVNGDPSQSHVGINLNGNVNHNAAGQGPTFNVGDSPFGNADMSGAELDDGDRWWAWVLNYGDRVDVFLEQNESTLEPLLPSSPIISYAVDLETILGGTTAFAGFTSATGADWSNHDLIYWRYTEAIDVSQAASVPEPSSMWLMLVGSVFIWRKLSGKRSTLTSRQQAVGGAVLSNDKRKHVAVLTFQAVFIAWPGASGADRVALPSSSPATEQQRELFEDLIPAQTNDEQAENVYRQKFTSRARTVYLAVAAPARPKSLSDERAQKSATELERAKQQFEERTKAAFQSMNETFEKAKTIAGNRGDTVLLKAIDKQKERMVRSRILPSVVPTAHFENDVVRAVVSIQKAYQRAITDATRSGETQKASMLAAELEKLVAAFHFDGRRCFRREGDAQYAVQPDDSWLETKARGQYVQFTEEKRTAEFIELKSKATDVRVRLYIDRVSLKHGYYPWGHFRKGAWVQ